MNQSLRNLLLATGAVSFAAGFLSSVALADGHDHHKHHDSHAHHEHRSHHSSDEKPQHHGAHQHHKAINYAPISVMGDHMHPKGDFMLSYRYMHMAMEESRIGTDTISPETIVTTVPNRFFGAPMQPPTLRVVPTEMTMDMHMFGAMYGVTDWLTIMAMAMYVEKEMDHVTFMGPAGTTELGEFTTETSGLGDTRLSGLIRIYEDAHHHFHVNMGISVPTGSTEEMDDILTPMNMRPTVRLPYPMQLGSGTYDLLPGITYTGSCDCEGWHAFSWGAQYMATLRLDDNDEGYSLGNEHKLQAWVNYGPRDWIALSFRAEGVTTGDIDGIDGFIMAPVQTANPDFHGGDKVNLGVGITMLGQQGHLQRHRLAVEGIVPVYQDLNGPQMEENWRVTIGWSKAF